MKFAEELLKVKFKVLSLLLEKAASHRNKSPTREESRPHRGLTDVGWNIYSCHQHRQDTHTHTHTYIQCLGLVLLLIHTAAGGSGFAAYLKALYV